ncbi:hypothetical protein Nocox_25895 [Nonomuraea coxensis DSM 45129]|uniref:HAD family hydrolase n=1 Tax=Nonomuraea coxensis DSM 45129 TaxID=1122611 RepID=A0ABX8U4W7_9ACTN|nr:hypothetical protein Nocox_25895 [Nonomuraea coxensis DSM 45129]
MADTWILHPDYRTPPVPTGAGIAPGPWRHPEGGHIMNGTYQRPLPDRRVEVVTVWYGYPGAAVGARPHPGLSAARDRRAHRRLGRDRDAPGNVGAMIRGVLFDLDGTLLDHRAAADAAAAALPALVAALR